jgi:hypothetical protein
MIPESPRPCKASRKIGQHCGHCLDSVGFCSFAWHCVVGNLLHLLVMRKRSVAVLIRTPIRLLFHFSTSGTTALALSLAFSAYLSPKSARAAHTFIQNHADAIVAASAPSTRGDALSGIVGISPADRV